MPCGRIWPSSASWRARARRDQGTAEDHYQREDARLPVDATRADVLAAGLQAVQSDWIDREADHGQHRSNEASSGETSPDWCYRGHRDRGDRRPKVDRVVTSRPDRARAREDDWRQTEARAISNGAIAIAAGRSARLRYARHKPESSWLTQPRRNRRVAVALPTDGRIAWAAGQGRPYRVPRAAGVRSRDGRMRCVWRLCARTAGVMTALMRNGQTVDGRTRVGHAILERVLLFGPDQRITSGPAA